jgi:hypothetical protein
MTPPTTSRREDGAGKNVLSVADLRDNLSYSKSAASEEEALPSNGNGFPTMHLQAASPDLEA